MMDRRGLFPALLGLVVLPSVVLASSSAPKWSPVLDTECGKSHPGLSTIDYEKLDDESKICRDCGVRHVPEGDNYGRACFTKDLVARIHHLEDEVCKVSGALQEEAHRNDDRFLQGEGCNRLEKLRDVTSTMTSKGNADYDYYNHGMANGLILAVSIMEDHKDVPQFLSWGDTR